MPSARLLSSSIGFLALTGVVIGTVYYYGVDHGDGKPVINFIGMATGTLATDVNTLKFTDRFSSKDHQLVGVVGFDSIKNGTIVQATWFSPDDRKMPLGRTEIVTESGAKIAKFSIANNTDWKPAPFMLDVYVYSRDESEKQYTATGSTHFFIGLEDKDVANYWSDFTAYTEAEEAKNRKREQDLAVDQTLLQSIRSALGTKNAEIALREDFSNDGVYDLMVVDPPATADSFMRPLLEQDIDQFVIFNKETGSTLLSLRNLNGEKIVRTPQGPLGDPLLTDDVVHTTVSVTGDVQLNWKEKDLNCEILLQYATGSYRITTRSCKEEEKEKEFTID